MWELSNKILIIKSNLDRLGPCPCLTLRKLCRVQGFNPDCQYIMKHTTSPSTYFGLKSKVTYPVYRAQVSTPLSWSQVTCKQSYYGSQP